MIYNNSDKWGERMKTIFKKVGQLQIDDLTISDCYFKRLQCDTDRYAISKKEHHHTFYEIHIISSGSQTYGVGNEIVRLDARQFVVFSPLEKHTVLDAEKNTEKYSLTFNINESVFKSGFIFGEINERIWDNIKYILEEHQKEKQTSRSIIENRICELIILFARYSGMVEPSAQRQPKTKDTRVALAKQYIEDNIFMSPTLSDVAAYCHIIEKQLNRLFLKDENLSVTDYIHKAKINQIEILLADDTLSLTKISEMLKFSSEYYLNTFFKKHIGMTPGEYRKGFINK